MVVAIVLIPVLIAIGMLSYAPASRVALVIYLPCLFLIPTYMNFPLGGLVLNVTSLLTLLIVGAALATWNFRFKFSMVDLCMLVYLFTAFYADANRGALKLGIYAGVWVLSKCLLPYIIGRLLIEQTGLRTEWVRSIVLCLAFIGVVSVIEYVMPYNLFQMVARKISHNSGGWIRQTRWGFGRIAGPYGSAIVASMVFSSAVFLQLWMVGSKGWDSFKGLRSFGLRRKRTLITFAVLLGLFMTQSRGPWLGFIFGLIVALPGFAKNRKRAATIALSTLIILGSVTYVFLNKYTDLSNKPADGDQENATYRRNLIVVYQPLIAQGGLWGWGTPMFFNHGVASWVPNHDSLVNEYLRVAMAQGYVGAGAFALMMLFGILRLARLCAQFRSRNDILFAYCMIGVILAISFSLSTVFLGDPMMQIVFLFMGWAQSVAPTKSFEQATLPAAAMPFAFERVFA